MLMHKATALAKQTTFSVKAALRAATSTRRKSSTTQLSSISRKLQKPRQFSVRGTELGTDEMIERYSATASKLSTADGATILDVYGAEIIQAFAQGFLARRHMKARGEGDRRWSSRAIAVEFLEGDRERTMADLEC